MAAVDVANSELRTARRRWECVAIGATTIMRTIRTDKKKHTQTQHIISVRFQLDTFT